MSQRLSTFDGAGAATVGSALGSAAGVAKALLPVRGLGRWWLALATLWLSLDASPVHAGQPRDWVFSTPPAGPRLLLDYFGTGAQATLQYNLPVYGKLNTLTTAVSTLVAYPSAEVVARADLRVLFLSVGMSAGYRALWRNLSFEPGQGDAYCSDCDRGARRKLDRIFQRSQSTDRFALFEGRVSLFAPFNKHLVLTSTLAQRYEGRRDLSFDWFFTNIHDGGWNTRWEANLFLRHRDWGAIAPYAQMMRLPRGSRRDVEWAFGFNALMRLGLIRRNDLLLLTFLTRPSDRYYGQHSYFLPARALLVYRAVIDL